ncbi:MAG: hypothetical protein ACREDR_32265 [Blastocatellia bacterium]
MDQKIEYEAGIDSNALKSPQRVVFITEKTSAQVKGDTGKKLMSYPHLMIREAIALEVLAIAIVLVALFWDAPLEQLANPLQTPNPAKAPWYFLGLQELLHYFPPLVAGIIIPTLVVLALIVIPYFGVNIKGSPLWDAAGRRDRVIFFSAIVVVAVFLVIYDAWTVLIPTLAVGILAGACYFSTGENPGLGRYFKSRPISWWIMTWFVIVATVLTVVGTFFRGPGWSWVMPWR